MRGHADSAGEPSRRLLDRYRLEEALGSGGAATVWRAYDEVLGRTVAVKLLHPHLATEPAIVERFRREASAAARLTHRNVVTLFDIGEDGGHPFLVMEFVEGPSLADVLADIGRMDAGMVAVVGEQIAGALGQAHEQGVVHRDVKPANVLLTRHGLAKVADFGIARVLDAEQAVLTSPGTLLGTANYLAPEQVVGGEIGPHTDVYALGLLLYECATGRLPFAGASLEEIAGARLEADGCSPRAVAPEIPTALDRVVATATRRHPSKRFADGRAVAAALAPLVAEGARERFAGLAARPGEAARRRHATPGASGPASAGATLAAPAAASASAPASETNVLGSETQVAGVDAGATRDGSRRDRAGGRLATGSWRDIAAAAVVLLLALIALQGLRGVTGNPDRGGGPEASPGEPFAVVAAGDFDPFGSGEEHRARVPHAYDGDPNTVWTTQTYRSAELGGLKPGVGIWFDLGEPHRVGTVTLLLATPGLDLEVYAWDALPDPPGDRAAWGAPVATVAGVAGDAQIPFDAAREAKVWLLWITKLPPGGSGFRAEIAGVSFLAG